MATKSLTFEIFGKDRSASKALKGVGDSAGDVGKRFAKMAAGVAIAVAAATAAMVATSVKAAAEMQKVDAQTDAVIKSTGAAAGKTAQHIERLSKDLSALSGIDDEVIQGGENILLTFTKIQGTNFDAATQSALDMSVALGTDMQSAALLVGKALNDPNAGITALTRSGVQFTDQQKDVIRALVETGQTAEAQRIILAELETQFGGSAEAFGDTFAGALGRFESSLGDVQEKVGMAFIPVLEELVDMMQTKILPAIESDLVPAFEGFATWLGEDGVDMIADFLDWLVTYKDELATTAGIIGTATVAMWGLNAAMAANPIGLAITGIAAAATAFVWLSTIVEQTNKNLEDGIVTLKELQDWWTNFPGVVGQAVSGVYSLVAGFINTWIDRLNESIAAITSAVSSLASLGGRSVAISVPSIAHVPEFSPGTQNYGGLTQSMYASQLRYEAQASRYGFARGGIVPPVPGGVPGVVAEAGVAEAVIPLTQQNMDRYLGGNSTAQPIEVTIVNNAGSELSQFLDVYITDREGRMLQEIQGGKVRR